MGAPSASCDRHTAFGPDYATRAAGDVAVDAPMRSKTASRRVGGSPWPRVMSEFPRVGNHLKNSSTFMRFG